jgi:hypothetical protein
MNSAEHMPPGRATLMAAVEAVQAEIDNPSGPVEPRSHAQAHGRRVISSIVGEAISHYEEQQMLRLSRGEMRSERNIRRRVGYLRRTLGDLLGLDRSIGSWP